MKMSEFNEFHDKLATLFNIYDVPLPEYAVGVVVNEDGVFVTDFEIPVSYDPEDATE